MLGLARRLRVGWVDVALAVGLSLLAVIEGPSRDSLDFSPAVLLCTAPLVVRRRWPIPVLLLALAGFSIAAEATNLASLVGGLIAAVTVGLDRRHRVLGAIAILGAAAAIAFEFDHGTNTTLPIPPFLAPFLMIGAAYLAGLAIASSQIAARHQRERADQLEREHDAAVQAATEAERRRIARELHDVIAHSVGVMVVQSGAARHVLDEKPDAARESLLAVEASGHEAMTELRRLLGVLGVDGEPAPLSPQPGVDRLDALVARVKEAGLPVALRIEGKSRPLPPGLDAAVYRIVQEALTNALKYAGGAPTQAVVRYAPGAVDIDVVDEGTLHAPAEGIGRGLAGMRERVAVYGGSIDAGCRDGRGYAVHAHLPTDDQE